MQFDTLLTVSELSAPDTVGQLLQDGYGNYIMQYALAAATPTEARELCRMIVPRLHCLRKNSTYCNCSHVMPFGVLPECIHAQINLTCYPSNVHVTRMQCNNLTIIFNVTLQFVASGSV
jgi:hypothetical protein